MLLRRAAVGHRFPGIFVAQLFETEVQLVRELSGRFGGIVGHKGIGQSLFMPLPECKNSGRDGNITPIRNSVQIADDRRVAGDLYLRCHGADFHSDIKGFAGKPSG